MTDTYKGNGESSSNQPDGNSIKRKSGENLNDKEMEDEELNDKANDYIKELLSERVSMNKKYPCADRLIENEIHKTQQTGRPPARDFKYDIYREKQVKVTVKVLVPIREHPKFNFVGKLLGPKGNSLKRLQEETMCKMAVLGRGSMKDRKKEEELRTALEPKYAHLNDDLHVEISSLGPPAEAHARVAFALAEVRKYLIPDSNDRIRQHQREMLNEELEHTELSLGEEEEAPPPMRYKKAIPPYRAAVPVQPPYRARVAMEENHPSKSMPHHPHHARYYEEPAHYDYGYQHPPAAPPRSKYEVPEFDVEYRVVPRTHGEYYREPPAYPVKSRAWKPAGAYSSSRDEETHGRPSYSHEPHYRPSPYPRPT